MYVAGPSNEQKEDFFANMVPYVIRNFQTFDPNDLREFVGAVQRELEGIDMGEAKKFTNPFPGLRPFETDEYRLFSVAKVSPMN